MEAGKRLESLDALRGFDMMFIAGFASLVIAICGLFPDGGHCWLESQMHHAEWNGFAHHDTIFPLFIFLAGVSFPFSFAKSKEKGMSMGRIYWKMVSRALILILLGLICNGLLKFEDKPLRYFSVLERIGVAGLVASILFVNFKSATRIVIAAVLLVGYAILNFIPSPEALPGTDPFSLGGSIVAYWDRLLFNDHLYKPGLYDPEGLVSTIGAVVTAMLGNFTGEYVKQSNRSGNKKSLVMAAAAAAMLIVGLIASIWIPINKKLWSSTFVLVSGAYSVAMFALFYWIIDVRGHKKWAFPFKVVGMNSIAIFMIQKVISFKHTVNFFFGGVIAHVDPAWGKVIYYIAYLALGWFFMWLMYKKRIFLKV